ncbi:MAG: outer membrane protein assembly factor BamB family protein [Planctomycetota bacterium]|jgi:outer membrane protein assembly factor BamB
MNKLLIISLALLATGLADTAGGLPFAGEPTGRPAAKPSEWRIFRGDAALTGTADGELPDKLAPRWQFKTAGAVKSSPVIAEGKVFVGSNDGNIYAIDLRRGTKAWSYKTEDAVEAPPCVVDGRVYVGSTDGNLYCLDTEGKLLWKYRTGDRIFGSANYLRVKAPDVEGGLSTRVIVGSYDNKLYCLRADKPERLWTYETEYWINGTPAVCAGNIVFGGCDEVIHVISAADGKRVRTIEVGSYIAASAALTGDEAYIGHFDGKLMRVDTSSGEIVWSYGDGQSAFFSSPAIGADRIVVGCYDRNVHCVSRKDGKKLWTFATGGQVESSPVICGEKVAVGSYDGRLYVLSLSDGSKLWSYDVGGAIATSPAVAEGMIIVGCTDGYIYAFGPQADRPEQTSQRQEQK